MACYFAFTSNLLSQSHTCFTTLESSAPTSVLSCVPYSDHIPTENDPVKTIKVAFHIMQKEAPFPKSNFDENNPAHVQFLDDAFAQLQNLFTFCNIQWCNGGYVQGLNQTRDSRIRFELIGKYYYRDNVGYNNQNGTYTNNYCYNNYAKCKDDILNIFFINVNTTSGGGYGPATHVMVVNYFDLYNQGGNSAWGLGNLMGHEIGHVLGMNHSPGDRLVYPDMCQSETALFWDLNNPGASNNFMGYSITADYMSPLQMARMNDNLHYTPKSKYLKVEYNPNVDVVINSPTVWDKARICYNRVLIEPGASLTITCKVIMAPGASIVTKRGARLIVDGGHISTKGYAEVECDGSKVRSRWLGIEVWGNTDLPPNPAVIPTTYNLAINDPGVVTLKNGAIIENAQVGIFGQQRGTPWEKQQRHFGGLVDVDGATFKNCRKAGEFISDKPLLSYSSFQNCKIEQTVQTATPMSFQPTYEGITSWQVNNILFDNCDFLKLDKGIVHGNSYSTIKQCDFNNNQTGVYMYQTYPLANNTILIGGDPTAENRFKQCEVATYAMTYDILQISYNKVEDCYYGFMLEGSSKYVIMENEFKQTNSSTSFSISSGIALLNTGEFNSGNSIICNNYIGSGTLITDGIFVGGNNKATMFNANHFRSKYDVRLEQLTDPNGTAILGALATQGQPGNPAYNEFTTFSTTYHLGEIFTPSLSINGSEMFTYWHPSGTCGQSQLIPRKPVQGTCAIPEGFVFRNQDGGNPGAPTCSFGIIDGLLAAGDCRTKACLDDYYVKITQKDLLLLPGESPTLLASVQNSPNSGSTIQSLLNASPYLSESATLSVQLPDEMFKSNEGVTIQLLDNLGKVRMERFKATSYNVFDVSLLPSGIYPIYVQANSFARHVAKPVMIIKD